MSNQIHTSIHENIKEIKINNKTLKYKLAHG